MTRYRRLILALALFATVGGAILAGGADAAQGAATKAPTKTDNPVVKLMFAAQLAALGSERTDPLLTMAAASLAREVHVKQGGRNTPGASGAPASDAKLVDDAALFAQARRFAGERQDLLALISEAEQSGSRGVVETVEAISGRLGGRESRTLQFTFTGDADAAVGVSIPTGQDAAAGADLDLYVHDQNGAAVCVSEGPGLPELCRWTPRRTGKFKIKIENRTKSAVDYTMVVR
jgi:hypothetical protein